MHPSISGKPMGCGRDIFTYVLEALQALQANAIPAISLDVFPSMVASAVGIVATDGLGAAIAVRLEDLMKPECANAYRGLDCAARSIVRHALRNFVIIGTAFPEMLRDVARGADQLVRHDWLFYHMLLGKLSAGVRQPNFGDSTIVHPKFAPVDMRKIKSAGKVVYTTSTVWEVRKGGAFRDNPGQMQEHCTSIVASGEFSGAGFSSGDDYTALMTGSMSGRATGLPQRVEADSGPWPSLGRDHTKQFRSVTHNARGMLLRGDECELL